MAYVALRPVLLLLVTLLAARSAWSQRPGGQQMQQQLGPDDVKLMAEELELRQASAKDGIVSMNTEEFKKFAFMPNRPYHLALFFVAKQLWDHPRTQLREVRKEYGYAADAFKRGSNPQKMVFVDLNLDKAQEVFQLLGIEHLPFIVHWPPSITTNDLGKSGGKALVSESNKFGKGIQKYPYPAEEMVKFFSTFVDSQPAEVDRPSIKKSPLFPVLVLALLAGLAVTAWRIINSPIIRSPAVWTAGSLVIYWFAVSGGLFNIIRGTPMYTLGENGKPKYFVEGRSYQFGAEGFIMGVLYVFFSMTLVGLVYGAPLISNKRLRSITSATCVGLAAISLRKIFELYTWKAGYHPTLYF